MDAEQGLFIQLLRQLAGAANGLDDSVEASPDLRRVYDHIRRDFPPCGESEIEWLLKKAPLSGSSLEVGFIWLEPMRTTPAAIPVLAFEYSFDARRKVCLRVAIFVPGDDQYPVGAIGYRLESPEGGRSHNFHHAQHIVDFGPEARPLPCPRWIPTSQPALPINAKDSVSLLVGLLVSLYGVDSDVVKNLLTTSHGYMVRPHLQGLEWWPAAS
jgi:hypothetical protein